MYVYIKIKERNSYFGESHESVLERNFIEKKFLHRCLSGILNLKIP